MEIRNDEVFLSASDILYTRIGYANQEKNPELEIFIIGLEKRLSNIRPGAIADTEQLDIRSTVSFPFSKKVVEILGKLIATGKLVAEEDTPIVKNAKERHPAFVSKAEDEVANERKARKEKLRIVKDPELAD